MSFLSGVLLPTTPSLHVDTTPKKSVTLSEKGLRDTNSHVSFVSPLLRLVRDPAGSIEELLETFWVEQSSEAIPMSASSDVETRKLLLQHRMQTAEDYTTWRTAALELDTIDGNDVWKSTPESLYYDHTLLQRRLEELNHARISGDPTRMLLLLRTSLSRVLGNMGDLKLYKHSRIGTKKLIDEYISAACDTMKVFLERLNSDHNGRIDRREALEQMLRARQSFGRSALLLSGGGTFGMSHIGVVKSLWEANLLPRIVCGSSAGSIICSVLCARTDDELQETLEEMCHGDLDVFERRGDEDSFLRKAARFAKFGALFDIQHLTRVMKGLLGDLTFQEAYFRTGRLLNISVSSAGIHELPRLLNYITSPNVIVWSAVAASCSVPLVFSPAIILAKDHETGEEYPWNPSQQLWIDGSVDNDLPMTRLAEMFNVNHFIVSQVNPHVVPFLVGDNSVLSNDSSGAIDPAATMGPSWLNSMASFAKSEALHRMHVLTELGVFPNYLTKLRSVLSQKYAGDITILPEISYASFPQILSNPTPEFMITSMRAGERATWLHLDRIRNHCAIELALDNLTMELRTSIVFSSSQVDLRLQTLAPGQSSSSRRRPRHRSKTKSWCAEPGKGFQHSFEMTPNSMRQIRIDAPVRESEWTEAETTAHEDISDEDYDDEEYLSFESSRRRKSRGTEPPKSPTSTSNQYGSKSNVSPLDFESSPGPDSPVSTFHRPTPRQLFSHGSNPNTPRNSFLPFSSIHSGPAANAGVRWALSPTEERDNLDLTMTNSMMAEQPGAAIGVESQVDHVTGVPTPGLSSAFRAGAKSTTSLPLQMSGITDLMTRRKSNR